MAFVIYTSLGVNYYFSAPNPCEINNGGCTHLCLLSSTNSSGYSCTCADGFYLDTDQRTCINPGSCRLLFSMMMESEVNLFFQTADDTGTPTTQVPPPGIRLFGIHNNIIMSLLNAI